MIGSDLTLGVSRGKQLTSKEAVRCVRLFIHPLVSGPIILFNHVSPFPRRSSNRARSIELLTSNSSTDLPRCLTLPITIDFARRIQGFESACIVQMGS